MSSAGYVRITRDENRKHISYGWSADIPPVDERPLALRDVQRFEVLEIAIVGDDGPIIMLAPDGWNSWQSVLHVALEAAAAGEPVLAHTLLWTWDEESADE